MRKSKLIATLGAAMTLGLVGCWDSSDVTLHEPGKYKGTRDPLLSQQASARTESLQKRFQLVQADR